MGAAASEPAGLLPRGQGWGAAACPPPPGAEEIPAARGGPRKGAECFWGDGKRWRGARRGSRRPGSPPRWHWGSCGRSGVCFPRRTAPRPICRRRRGAGSLGGCAGESGVSGGDGGGSMPQHAAMLQHGSPAGHGSPPASLSRHAGSQLDGASLITTEIFGARSTVLCSGAEPSLPSGCSPRGHPAPRAQEKARGRGCKRWCSRVPPLKGPARTGAHGWVLGVFVPRCHPVMPSLAPGQAAWQVA